MGTVRINQCKLFNLFTLSLTLFACSLTCPSPTQATSFYPQLFSVAVQAAPVIVRGTVGLKHPEWGDDTTGTKQIYTYYELQVKEPIKGNVPDQTLSMREMGGEKEGIGLQIPGTANFSTGEDVVVLLRERNTDGSFNVDGMMMGRLSVQTDSDGNETLQGPAFMHQPHSPSGEQPKAQWSLKDLRELVRKQDLESPAQTSQPQTRTTQLTPVSATSTQNLNPSSAPTPDTPAPELQLAPATGESQFSWFRMVWILALGILAFGAFRWSRSKS